MNISIIGAGLTGRLLAWQLLEQGAAVTLIDKDHGNAEQSAAFVAAAMLAPFTELLDADEPAIYQQGFAGIEIWQAWQKQLGADFDLRTDGSLVVAHRQDSGNYQHFMQRLSKDKTVEQERVQELSLQELKQIEPELAANFNKACFLQGEGCLDNRALLPLLKDKILALGGQLISDKAVSAINETDFPAADFILDCRGYGAREQLNNLRGVRGEVIRVHAPEVNISRPVRLMHPRYNLYIAPRANNHYVIGATQIESNDESAVTVRSSLELLSALYTLHTGFAEAKVLEMQARCRPAFADNMPRIIKNGKVLHINGLYRHGYLLAPAVVGEVLAQLGFAALVRWEAISAI